MSDRPELNFGDPFIQQHRSERLNRLGTSEAEHTYLHSTSDDAIRELQAWPFGCASFLVGFWLLALTAAVVWLYLR